VDSAIGWTRLLADYAAKYLIYKVERKDRKGERERKKAERKR